jgi:hypothetical protein
MREEEGRMGRREERRKVSTDVHVGHVKAEG